MDVIKFAKTLENAVIPTTATDGAAGFDLYSAELVTVAPYNRTVINTGISVILPPATYGRIADKSGLAAKCGLIVLGGVVDTDYTGAIKVIIYNSSGDEYVIPEKTPVAQLICEVFKKPFIVDVTKVCIVDGPKSVGRGDLGLGSGIGPGNKESTNVATTTSQRKY